MTAEWEDAVRRGDVARLSAMLTSGEKVDSRDRHGQTALMIAAAQGRDEVVRLLIDAGAALDVTAKYGLSALMIAVVRGHSGVVELLVAAGADSALRGTGAPGFAGKTALDLARDRGDAAAVAALTPSRRG